MRLWWLTLFLATASFAAEPPPAAPSPAVMLDGQALFPVRVPLGAFSAQERAAASTARLIDLAGNPLASAELGLVEVDGASEVVAGDVILFAVTDADALAAQLTRAALAKREASLASSAIKAYRDRRSTRRLLVSAAEALGLTLALVLLFWGLARLTAFARARIARWETSARGLRIQSLVLATPARIAEVLDFAVRTLRWVLAVLLLYLYLPLTLELFPWTRGLARQLIGYVLGPLQTAGSAVVNYLPKLFFIVVAIFVARQLVRFVAFLFREVERGTLKISGFHVEWARPTFQIARVFIIVFTAVVVFPYLPGAQSSAFQNISLFVGLLVSLGSSSAVANAVAGVILTYTRAFRLGDRVQIGDTQGDVVEKTLLVTRLRTIKNVHVSIPNAVVLSAQVQNFSLAHGGAPLLLHTEVTIGYDSPWRQIHELLETAARQTPHIVAEPAPFVLQPSLDDFYVTYQLNASTDAPAQMAVTYSLLHQNIQDAFAAAGVEIMSPHYNSLRDGNKPALPPARSPTS